MPVADPSVRRSRRGLMALLGPPSCVRDTGLMRERVLVAVCAGAVAVVWLSVLAFVAIPSAVWWQGRLRQPAAVASAPVPTSTTQPTGWQFSVLEAEQRSFDRLPGWVQAQNGDMSPAALESARMVADLPHGRVYLTGTHRGGCLVVTDDLARGAGYSCGSWRPPSAPTMGSSSVTEPCGLVVVLVPDGYTNLDPTVPAGLIYAHGRNAIVLVNSASLRPTSLVGAGQQPLPISPLPMPLSTPTHPSVGC